jgi:hypothetical protein
MNLRKSHNESGLVRQWFLALWFARQAGYAGREVSFGNRIVDFVLSMLVVDRNRVGASRRTGLYDPSSI